MAKKIEKVPAYPEAPLVITCEKFCGLLAEQIKRGEELLQIDVPRTQPVDPYCGFAGARRSSGVEYDEAAMNDFEAQYSRWNDKNKTIYRTSFSVANSIYFHEYESHIWNSVWGQDAVKDTKDEIKRLINHMQGDIERSGLIKCEVPADAVKECNTKGKKRPLVFISHRGTQVQFVSVLVDLLEKCGFKSDNLFCSSVPGFNIGLDEDIIETLRKKFVDYDLYVVYVFSTDFFQSPYCLNEMGAAWVLQVENSIIVTRDMDETVIDGVVNKTKTRVSFNDSVLQLKNRMAELRDKLLSFARLPKVEEVNWNRYYDKFISDVNSIAPQGVIAKPAKADNPSMTFTAANPDDVVQKAINRLGEFTVRELQDATGIQNYHYIMQKLQVLLRDGTLEAIGDNVHRKYRIKV